jgi:hypothetical protein
MNALSLSSIHQFNYLYFFSFFYSYLCQIIIFIYQFISKEINYQTFHINIRCFLLEKELKATN